jgi:hypothetical protein
VVTGLTERPEDVELLPFNIVSPPRAGVVWTHDSVFLVELLRFAASAYTQLSVGTTLLVIIIIIITITITITIIIITIITTITIIIIIIIIIIRYELTALRW